MFGFNSFNRQLTNEYSNSDADIAFRWFMMKGNEIKRNIMLMVLYENNLMEEV